MKTNPFNTIMQLINSNDLRLLKKIAAMLYFYPIAKDPDHGVKVRQNFAFSFLIAFFIYLSGFDSFSFSKIPMTDSLDNFSLGTPQKNYIKQYNRSVIKTYSFYQGTSMPASVSKRLLSRILESSPKLSKTLAKMKHYKKIYLMK